MSKMFNGLLVRFDENFESHAKVQGKSENNEAKMERQYEGRKHLQPINNKQNKSSNPLRAYLVGSFIGKLGFKK